MKAEGGELAGEQLRACESERFYDHHNSSLLCWPVLLPGRTSLSERSYGDICHGMELLHTEN
jgi:hypothetical protein